MPRSSFSTRLATHVFVKATQKKNSSNGERPQLAHVPKIRTPVTQSLTEYEIVLAPGRADTCYWRDLWQYRELFQVLAWRDVSVRYKQTMIGAAWAVVRPLLTMLVFTIVFGKLAKLTSVLRAGDRVEIYRRLTHDPKEARKKRVADIKKAKKNTGSTTD